MLSAIDSYVFELGLFEGLFSFLPARREFLPVIVRSI